MMNFKTGDKVICIDNNEYSHITQGRVYTVIRRSYTDAVEILNDAGLQTHYLSYHFKKVSKGYSTSLGRVLFKE